MSLRHWSFRKLNIWTGKKSRCDSTNMRGIDKCCKSYDASANLQLKHLPLVRNNGIYFSQKLYKFRVELIMLAILFPKNNVNLAGA